MTNIQLYLAIGVPTVTVLLGILVGVWQTGQMVNQMNLRFTVLEGRFNLLDQDMKMLVRASNDLDVRLARLEERLAR